MGRVDGNQPVQLNSIDTIFDGRGGNDTEIITGLMTVFGEDNDVTYLISHVKKDEDISVERDADGHLNWKIGTTDVKIGSSWWTRFTHSIKKIFSADYGHASEVKVMQNADKIRRAYVACLAKEHADIDAADQMLAKLKDQREAADGLIAQNQEQVRVAQEKTLRIADLKAQFKMAKSDLDGLNQALDEKNKGQDAKELALSENRSALKQLNEQTARLNENIKLFQRGTVLATCTVYFPGEEDEQKGIENILGSLETEESRKAIFVGLNNERKRLTQEINENTLGHGVIVKSIEDLKELGNLLTGQITDKDNKINELRNSFQALGVDADASDVVSDIVQPPVVDPAIAEAKSKGLDDDEARLYVELSPLEKEHYDWIRLPADGATPCPVFADFLLTLIRGRNAVRVDPKVTLNPGEVDIKLGGNDAKITLPKDLQVTYSVDKQAWNLSGDGLNLKIKGMDVSLDNSNFEIHDQHFTIKLDKSKLSFGVKAAMLFAGYSDGITIPFDVVKQDIFHSNNQV